MAASATRVGFPLVSTLVERLVEAIATSTSGEAAGARTSASAIVGAGVGVSSVDRTDHSTLPTTPAAIPEAAIFHIQPIGRRVDVSSAPSDAATISASLATGPVSASTAST